VPFLREHGALPSGAVVADIGAGTGMLAEIFLEAGHRVLAVEPNAEMLEACRALAAQHPALEAVEGSAEATTLPDASVDLIAVGRAMHWFDWPHAHREFQRILKPDGWVLVATNGHRDSGAPVSNRLSRFFANGERIPLRRIRAATSTNGCGSSSIHRRGSGRRCITPCR
jgi:ubiquinone/menaquinone biosynthesis C-methylase UbiE